MPSDNMEEIGACFLAWAEEAFIQPGNKWSWDDNKPLTKDKA